MEKSFKANIGKMYAFHFLRHLSFIGGVMLPFFMDWGGIEFHKIMILQAWFSFCFFALEIPTGTIADYFGRKYSLIAASFVNMVGAVIYILKPEFKLFLLAEFLWAGAGALASGADKALVYDSLKKIGEQSSSKKVFVRMESFRLAGIMIGAPVGSFLASRFGVRIPMLALVVPFALSLFIGWRLKEPKTHEKKESRRYIEILKRGGSFLYGHKILRILALDMIVVSIAGYFMIWLYQPLLERSGVEIVFFGLVHALLTGVQIFFANIFEWAERILGSKKRILFLSTLIPGLLYVAGGFVVWAPLVLVVIVFGGGLALSRRPLFESYMNKYIPSDRRATVLSSVSMIRRLGIMILNPAFGYLGDWSFGYTLAIIGGLLLLFSFLSKTEEDHLLE